MREGPSKPLYRGRLQTALKRLGLRALVVSVQGKVGPKSSAGEDRGDERK